MKTRLMLASAALISCGALAQPTANPTAPAPTTPAPAPALTAAAPPAPAPSEKKTAPPAEPAQATTAKPAESAVPLVPGPAIVTASALNVRGQARLDSDRVAQLKEGDSVMVLEEIVLDKPAPGEPARWVRIALPTEVKVWVHSLFIDTTNKTVIPDRLNLRNGPGENYSVLGLIEKGYQIQEAGVVDGDWIQIEAPTNTYAFVASQFLQQDPALKATAAKPAPAEAKPPAPAPEPKPVPDSTPIPAPVETTVTEPPPVAPPVTEPPPAGPVAPPAFADASPAAPGTVDEAAIEKARAAMRREMAKLIAQQEAAAGVMPVPTEPGPPRIVSHEGVVRRTWSIQAPTKFALVDPDSGKTVNYLYTTSTNLDLAKYKGLRIAVTGEEGLDERWTETPVLTIKRIHVLE